VTTVARPGTTVNLEQFLALLDDRTDRELIRGELREKPRTFADRWHGQCAAEVGTALLTWLDAQPKPRGEVVIRAGFHLHSDPDTLVGVALAVVSAEVVARTPDDGFFEGPPVLAIEILSSWDTQGEIDEKIELYLGMGAAIVWVISPRFRTVTVYRPGAEPELFNALQERLAEPHLPRFRVPVAKFFAS
jgi:Uma2 family endonuclease